MRSSDWSSDVCSSDLPEAGFLAAEYFITGVASLLGQLRAAGDAPSLRLYIGDARDLLDCLPDGVLDRIFILFPDPWPKRRHHKRRLIQNATVDRKSVVKGKSVSVRLHLGGSRITKKKKIY